MSPESESQETKGAGIFYYEFDRFTTVEHLVRVYHYSYEDARGRYYLGCREMNSPCNRCMGSQSSSCPSAFLTVSITGSDAALLMAKFQEQDMREIFREGVYHGAPLPGEAKKGAHGWEDALQKFPNDVEFLSRAEAERNKETTRKLLNRKIKIPFEEQWTDERVAAVVGSNLVAKRAAMSNTLWKFYKSSGSALTLDDLKHIYKIGLFQELWEKESIPEKKTQYWEMLQATISERS